MNEEHTALGPGNRIDARLYAIEYPTEQQQAVVTFELFSTGHALGGPHRLLAQISNRVALDGAKQDDYEQIITAAATKLSTDLARAAWMVRSTYMADDDLPEL